MSITILRHWLGTTAPSPHDTELRRAVRDALIEYDAVLDEARLDEEGWHALAVDAVRALEALESCIAWSDSMQQWVCVGRERLQPALAMARSALEEATACRCCECGALLSVSNEEKRPYVALPGDVVAYSTHCKGGCEGSSELATQRAGWSPT